MCFLTSVSEVSRIQQQGLLPGGLAELLDELGAGRKAINPVETEGTGEDSAFFGRVAIQIGIAFGRLATFVGEGISAGTKVTIGDSEGELIGMCGGLSRIEFRRCEESRAHEITCLQAESSDDPEVSDFHSLSDEEEIGGFDITVLEATLRELHGRQLQCSQEVQAFSSLLHQANQRSQGDVGAAFLQVELVQIVQAAMGQLHDENNHVRDTEDVKEREYVRVAHLLEHHELSDFVGSSIGCVLFGVNELQGNFAAILIHSFPDLAKRTCTESFREGAAWFGLSSLLDFKAFANGQLVLFGLSSTEEISNYAGVSKHEVGPGAMSSEENIPHDGDLKQVYWGNSA